MEGSEKAEEERWRGGGGGLRNDVSHSPTRRTWTSFKEPMSYCVNRCQS